MRARLGLSVLVLSAAVAPASAAPAKTAIVLTGGRSASSVVTFTRTVTLHNDGYRGDGPSITSAGDLGGYLLTDVSGRRFVAGAFRTTEITDDGQPLVVYLTADRVTLKPGRYLLTLLASGSTEVRIPVAGLRSSVTHRPTTPVPVKAEAFALSQLPVATSGAGRTPVTVRPASVAFLGIETRSTGVGNASELCLTWRGAGCDEATVGVQTQTTIVGGAEVDQDRAGGFLVEPGDARPGDYDAVVSTEAHGLHTTQRGFVLVVR